MGSREGLLDCERGGVFAEAVICLPVIVLVWSLMAFVNGGYDRVLRVGTDSRGQAWRDALGACEGELDGPTEAESQGTFFVTSIAPVAAIVPSASGLLTRQPLLAARTDTLRFEIGAHRYRQDETVDRPAGVGGTARLGYHVDLPCDERHDEVNLGRWILTATRTVR
ncbi:MAG: hypothetical protein KF901_03635 [Myxococcales bacterium]|nr:hypothetical protein [Myxococcales bacterium]